MLDEFGANATIKNSDDVSAIDMALLDDLKDIKAHFMRSLKYSKYDFTGQTTKTESNSDQDGQFAYMNQREHRKSGYEALTMKDINKYKRE
mmetsp:Transcript_2997/g.5069  ORF Transcript_2997/g.5069 Transcript_2997/m.5069 type:complete len:91 (-) Transcript_2997:25-297(-)